MGIYNLKKILHEENCLIYHNSYKDFYNTNFFPKLCFIGIDFNLYYYKYKSVNANIFKCFFKQILFFLEHRTIPIYLFDGKSVPLKKKIKAKTGKLKNLYIPYGKFKMFFDTLKIQYYQSSEEADSLSGILYRNKIIDCCLTDDIGDYLCYGCDLVIELIKNGVYVSKYNYIQKKLNFYSKDEFIIFCILLGCDYYKTCIRSKYREIFYIFRNSKKTDNINEYIINIFQTFKVYEKEKSNYMKIIDAFLLFTKNSNLNKMALNYDHFSKVPLNSILPNTNFSFDEIPFVYFSLLNKYKYLNSKL